MTEERDPLLDHIERTGKAEQVKIPAPGAPEPQPDEEDEEEPNA